MEANKNIQARPPIVVVLGHVDHGKTTLLDAIRKTNVASKEAGGITQAIGASVVETKEGKKITFIDTPGHAAFGRMRSRGAKVADIAVLVVAQDDGVQPQTREALQIIKDSNLPFVVAGTKADIAGVSPEKLRGELEKEGVFFEGRGGQTPFVSVSAKTNTGVTDLIEILVLMSEVAGFKGDPNAELEAVVIESGKDKMGPTASVVVRQGSIKVGETIYAEEKECKVRALFDDKGKSIKEVMPGFPAKVFGFTQVPPVGALVSKKPLIGPLTDGLRVDKGVGVQRQKARGAFDLRRLQDDEVPVILKAGSAGSLEAIINSLPPKIVVVDSGVGDITSSDVINAKTGNAFIFAFESKIPKDVFRLATAEKVRTERFDVIYKLLERLDEILRKDKKEILGKAEILASFPFDHKKVAGCKVIYGRISKGDELILNRGEKEVGKAKAISIRKQKVEVSSVGQSEEFGIIFDPQLDFQVHDVLLSVSK
jgi:translation initiation factor IF-2